MSTLKVVFTSCTFHNRPVLCLSFCWGRGSIMRKQCHMEYIRAHYQPLGLGTRTYSTFL